MAKKVYEALAYADITYSDPKLAKKAVVDALSYMGRIAGNHKRGNTY